MNNKRFRKLNENEVTSGPIVYWMSRDQRVKDNWALIHSRELAKGNEVKVVFCLVDDFLEATDKQYSFMLDGLKQVSKSLKLNGIDFEILKGEPQNKIPDFLEEYDAGALITDFDPLKIKREWKDKVNKKISVAFHEVDAHNIVPCWIASQKKEYAAYTLRPKIHKLLPEFLEDFPKFKIIKENSNSGEMAAEKVLNNFIKNKLKFYNFRNDPNEEVTSNLSPYLHFGQIASQRVALEIKKSDVKKELKEAFLEELIVRKELADNFCFYEKNYDSFEGFHDWAKKTLNEHRKDNREYIYSLKDLEKANTHDDLWNAAQLEMVKTGKMHGYMRMYWGKKILEWTESPEKAMEFAIYLNNKYELDGRDPNGYTGVAWSIGGVHDRAWKERPIFGKIRYMNYNGAKSKFRVDSYIDKIRHL